MAELQAARSALKAWESVLGMASLEPFPELDRPIWRVVADTGRHFVLKRLPEFPPGVGPVDGFRVVSYLHGAGVPVAPPIIADDGNISAAVEDRSYALLPFVPSDPGNHERGRAAAETSYEIGAAIGRFDQALLDCPWSVRSYADDPARQILDGALPELADEVTRPVAPLVNTLHDAISGLPTQRTHGDCNTGNVLVHSTRVSAFIDIDHLPIGPRVRDLSYYLSSRLGTHVVGAAPERDLNAMIAVLGDYVAGYHDANPLSEQERAAIIPLILVVTIGIAHWCLHSWNPNPTLYRENVHAIDWLAAHFDELTKAAAGPAGRTDRSAVS